MIGVNSKLTRRAVFRMVGGTVGAAVLAELSMGANLHSTEAMEVQSIGLADLMARATTDEQRLQLQSLKAEQEFVDLDQFYTLDELASMGYGTPVGIWFQLDSGDRVLLPKVWTKKPENWYSQLGASEASAAGSCWNEDVYACINRQRLRFVARKCWTPSGVVIISYSGGYYVGRCGY